MTSRTFGQIVREARLERHLSMGQLAAAVDRSTASVRRWERDDGLPTLDVIEALIVRLDLDPDEVAAALGAADGSPAEAGSEPSSPPTLEEGDPIDVVALSDVADAVGAGSMVDWEQPAIADPPQAPSTPEPALLRTAPAPPAPWPTSSVPVAVIERDQNLLQILRDPDKPWLGYIRAAMTIAVLGGLVWVLMWTLPEFVDAFGEMWDSLWETEGTSA